MGYRVAGIGDSAMAVDDRTIRNYLASPGVKRCRIVPN
jgi:hypothetical protein